MAYQRLQKILAEAGVASRRKAEQLIAEGHVSVNGSIVTKLGSTADPVNDMILVDKKPIHKQKYYYFLFNKPKGVITTTHDELNRKTVTDFFKAIPARVYPIGRLDENTSGLLLITNDGDFANKIMHPKYVIDKSYQVWIEGRLMPHMQSKLEHGVRLKDGITSPAIVSDVRYTKDGRKCIFNITIHEGKNRQVRRMCAALGLTVVELKRIGLGGLTLGTLRPGEFRPLSVNEISFLLGENDKGNF